MPHTLVGLYVHVVFSTKNRAPWITTEIERGLYPFVGSVVRRLDCVLLASNGTADHSHLLLSLVATANIAALVREVKKSSSRWIKESFSSATEFGWQDGYGAFSVSESNLDRVRSYIARQKEHHARKSFEDEYRSLARKHRLAFDERFLFG